MMRQGHGHSFAVQRKGAINAVMTKTAASALFMFLTLAGAAPAMADCYQIADQLAARYEAEVISVTDEGGTCVIKLRIPGQGGQPPRVETFREPA